ncbi:DUF447 domain-containing protein [Haloarchaeobius litoreus]|uniref:DUF447 domain-containing protein n=1 Tax=Haloarchaeobius litoreus TaxID=755306 RepID=A0ABD6DHU7_9EURY
MSDEGSADDGDGNGDWPVDLRGVTESVVATEGPNGRWNLAALGLHAGDPVTARTWGRTRTRLNFDRRAGAVVQFTRDPVEFTRAALDVYEREEPVLHSSQAWARVEVEHVTAGDDGGTEWAEWELHPVESTVERRSVEPINRAFGALVEATVAASRLDVPSYDESTLRRRLSYFDAVVERCGGPREREAMALIGSLTDWKTENESF